jgi:RNA ligase (TIGR02306 family)
MQENDRKLATIRTIDAINPIDGADQIEVATVGGWKVVVKKGEFNVGDLAVYFEIDSWIPTELASFLSKGKEPHEYNGVKGERLRTARLRKQLSQGLLLPIPEDTKKGAGILIEAGLDVTDHFGIQKWEPPFNAQLAGMCKGNFPSFIPKTNEERIQNLSRELQEWAHDPDLVWEVTEKLDGSSMTVYINNGEFGVCSRNLELKLEDTDNAFVSAANSYELENKLRNSNRNLALQGELISSGIQGNPYRLNNGQSAYFIYKIWDIDNQCYLSPKDRRQFCKDNELTHVPLISLAESLLGKTMEQMLEEANGESVLNANTKREGLVFKSKAGSFKAISNDWLLAGND